MTITRMRIFNHAPLHVSGKWREEPAATASRVLVFLLILFLPLASARAQESIKPLVVWDFNRSLVNPLGGKYSVFQGGLSWVRTFLEHSSRERMSDHSLRITAHREAKGFCGVWFNFYSARELPEQYLDASPFRYLSFRVKGAKGGEDFDITLQDSTWRQHEDVNPTRPLRAYLPGGAPTAWREVLIPLSDFAGLDSSKLFNLILVFSKEGDYQLEVDDIAFVTGPGGLLNHPSQPVPSARLGSSSQDGRGLWVWNTNELLDPANAGQLDSFFGFCAAQSINEVFLSV